MFSLVEEFDLINNKTKKVEDCQNNLDEAKKERLEYFKDITILLNNHRSELREIEGLENFNYAIPKNEYEFDGVMSISFTKKPTAKGLAVLEEITGCEFEDIEDTYNMRNEIIVYFSL